MTCAWLHFIFKINVEDRARCALDRSAVQKLFTGEPARTDAQSLRYGLRCADGNAGYFSDEADAPNISYRFDEQLIHTRD